MVERLDPRQRSLVTPEGLVVPFMLASRGSRVAALLIDLLCMGLALVAALVAIGFTAGGLGEIGAHLRGGDAGDHAMQALFALWIIAGFLIRNAWFMAFELGPRGATPGKRMMGIRIAARDGARLTPERVIARNLVRDIEIFLPLSMVAGVDGGRGGLAGAWFLIFALLPLFNRDRLRAGDLIAGTWVVERPRQRLAPVMADVMTTAPVADYRFREADLAMYGEYELQRLEEVLRLRRPEPMTLVAGAIAGKIGWSAPHGEEVGPFLDAYYAQLRARLESGMRMGRRKFDKNA